MRKVSIFGSVGVILGGLMAVSPAAAQGVAEGQVSERVIVVAPYITQQQQSVIGAGNKGVYDINSLSKQVSYSDLDLSRQSDADRLIQRVNDAAKQACAELKAKFPDPPNAPVLSDQDCLKNASDKAMLIVTAAIDRARVARNTTPAPGPVAQAAPMAAPEPAPSVQAQATETLPPKQDRN